MGQPIVLYLLCVLCVVGTWVVLCLYLGVQVDRWDLMGWGGLALLPCVLFILFVCGEMLRGALALPFSQFLLICGTTCLIYVLILLVEGGLMLGMAALARTFHLTLSNTPWALLAPALILFAYGVPAFLEETGKYLIVRIHGPSLEGPYPLVILGMTGALILSSIENAQYTLTMFYTHSNSQQGCCTDWVTMAITISLRDLCSVTLHVCTGALLGASYFRWREEASMSRGVKWVRSLAMPVFLHGTYDGAVLFMAVVAKRSGVELTWLLLVPALIVVFAVLLAFRKTRKAYRLQIILRSRSSAIELEQVV